MSVEFGAPEKLLQPRRVRADVVVVPMCDKTVADLAEAAPSRRRVRRLMALAGVPMAFGAGFTVLGAGPVAAVMVSAMGSLAVGGLRAAVSDAVV